MGLLKKIIFPLTFASPSAVNSSKLFTSITVALIPVLGVATEPQAHNRCHFLFPTCKYNFFSPLTHFGTITSCKYTFINPSVSNCALVYKTAFQLS
jgi:hypothetical protein